VAISWQRLRVPLLERLALADLAERKGVSEEELLRQIIREALLRELASKPQEPEQEAHHEQ